MQLPVKENMGSFQSRKRFAGLPQFARQLRLRHFTLVKPQDPVERVVVDLQQHRKGRVFDSAAKPPASHRKNSKTS
jgi:hypothetical protein